MYGSSGPGATVSAVMARRGRLRFDCPSASIGTPKTSQQTGFGGTSGGRGGTVVTAEHCESGWLYFW